jgi:3-oxoacyl-[acyl-carrier-protein] synthase-1
MIRITGTNIISSLGFTTQENFDNLLAGKSGLQHYESLFDLPELVVASLVDKERLNEEFDNLSDFQNLTGFETTLEKAAILSVFIANQEAKIDLSGERVLFVLSTTKGNVELLDMQYAMANNESVTNDKWNIYLWHSARTISQFFSNPNTPLVVSNACISGAAAQIAALRELENGNFDYAVVVGADFLSKFIVSGFQSFKALSQEVCKPFDDERNGLNLGEAAATIIFSIYGNPMPDIRQSEIENWEPKVHLISGAISNDATHISAPSRVGEGSFRVLSSILNTDYSIPKEEIAFISAHGTATPYNDAMEMQAIQRADLQDVPTNSLKAYFGHTLGAAGVLESIISMKALERGIVTGPLNSPKGDFPINIVKEQQKTDKRHFIKLLSGFGGVNAALLFEVHLNPPLKVTNPPLRNLEGLFIKNSIALKFNSNAEMTDCYYSLQIDYPKFFKMDNLSKLGFLAAENLLTHEYATENNSCINGENHEDVAIICFNRSSSLNIDNQYLTTIKDSGNYFPSPSLFVYTLPNIVAGEIAIRHKIHGETAFYVSENFDAEQIVRITKNTFTHNDLTAALVAWIEGLEVKIWLVTKEKSDKEFNVINLQ